MGRWSDVQNGRVDLVAEYDDRDTGRSWQLFRVVVEADSLYDEPDDRLFIARLREEHDNRGVVKMECFLDIADAVNRCTEWAK